MVGDDDFGYYKLLGSVRGVGVRESRAGGRCLLVYIYIYILANLGALRAPLLARTPDR